jgi:hypothetical protein
VSAYAGSVVGGAQFTDLIKGSAGLSQSGSEHH